MEGSIIFYTYGSTLELNGQQFEAGRLTEDLLNLSPDDYHPLHERMVRIRTLMDIYEYVRKSELWWKLNDEMEQLCQELRRYTVFRPLYRYFHGLVSGIAFALVTAVVLFVDNDHADVFNRSEYRRPCADYHADFAVDYPAPFVVSLSVAQAAV